MSSQSTPVFMSIHSIDKVDVIKETEVLKFDSTEVARQKQGWGVYLIFSEPSPSYRKRSFCKIGRASGKSRNLRERLLGNLNYHGGPDDECLDGPNHSFQVLYCNSPTDAARLEALFHLWHGGYRRGEHYNSRMPIEPKGKPKAKSEPDFFTSHRRRGR